MKNLALFDQDDTITQGNVAFAFYTWLADKKIVDEEKVHKNTGIRMGDVIKDYKAKTIDQNTAVERYTQLMACAVEGMRIGEIKTKVPEFFNEKVKMWDGVKNAFDDLKENGFDTYITYIISASPAEVVSYTTKQLGATGYRSTVLKTNQGVYTGRGVGLTSERKNKTVKKLVKKYGSSLGVGDSEGDLGIFDNVDVVLCWNFRNPELIPKLRSVKGKTVLEFHPNNSNFYEAVTSAMKYLL